MGASASATCWSDASRIKQQAPGPKPAPPMACERSSLWVEVIQSLKDPQLPPRVGARVVVVMTGMKTGEMARIPATRELLALDR
jgi:hypothetical protein